MSLTGLKVTKVLPASTQVKGLDVTGSVSIVYSSPDKGKTRDFTFSGTVMVTSAAQDSGSPALKGVAAQLNLTVSDDADGLHLAGIGIAAAGDFRIFGVDVSAPAAQPLSFQYNMAQDQYQVGGALNLHIKGNTVLLNLGTTSSPGIILKGGVLTQFNGYVAADFTLFGVSVATNGLTFTYKRDTSGGKFEIIMKEKQRVAYITRWYSGMGRTTARTAKQGDTKNSIASKLKKQIMTELRNDKNHIGMSALFGGPVWLRMVKAAAYYKGFYQELGKMQK